MVNMENMIGGMELKKQLGRQDGGRVGGHARPLPQTHTHKNIYRLNDSHRTATNHWQKNLNSNNGKNLMK